MYINTVSEAYSQKQNPKRSKERRRERERERESNTFKLMGATTVSCGSVAAGSG